MNAPAVWPRPDRLVDDGIAVLRYAAEAVAAGIATALVTLTEIRGGASRRLGSQMVVLGDGRYRGFVSGGCVEAAAAAEALEALAVGSDREVRFGEGSPFFDIVLPCGGGITLAIHILRSADPLLHALSQLHARTPITLRYEPRLQLLECMAYTGPSHWRQDGFDVGYLPQTRLMICGGSIEAQATAAVGHCVGYDIQGWSSESDAINLVDSNSAVILLFHDLDRERAPLRAALDSSAFYIGTLGSRATHQRRVDALLQLGYSQRQVELIRAPIGLFPRARDAYSLALSILAEVASARTAMIDTPADALAPFSA